jgi:hypothetical protein
LEQPFPKQLVVMSVAFVHIKTQKVAFAHLLSPLSVAFGLTHPLSDFSQRSAHGKYSDPGCSGGSSVFTAKNATAKPIT